MSQALKPTRIQVVVNPHDRAAAEVITEQWYGLSLSQFLRLVVKLIAQEKLDIGVVEKLDSSVKSKFQ